MRWLVVHPGPDFSVADVHNGWVEALRDLGEQVAVYNLHDRLCFYDAALLETGETDGEGHPEVRKAVDHDEAIRLAANGLLSAAYQWWPEVILCVSAFFTPPPLLDLLRSRRHKVILLHTEAPYQDADQIERSAHADVALLNDPATIDAYRAVCPVAEYVPHAYRSALHRPGQPSPRLRSDLCFVGTGYDSRIAFFEAMNLDGLDVLLAGNWQQADPHIAGKRRSPLVRYLAHAPEECVDNEQAVRIYRSSKAGINFYRREADQGCDAAGWAMGPREVEMAATGLWFLRDPRGEGDELLPMLPTFDGPGDASEKLRWWLDRDAQRADAAEEARTAVAGRTFDANARMLLRLLDRQPVTLS